MNTTLSLPPLLLDHGLLSTLPEDLIRHISSFLTEDERRKFMYAFQFPEVYFREIKDEEYLNDDDFFDDDDPYDDDDYFDPYEEPDRDPNYDDVFFSR